jgi:hypothetical protein
MKTELLRFNNTLEQDPAIEPWFQNHTTDLAAIAHHWWKQMRNAGDEVFHDGCPNACLGDIPFACVNIFRAHVNVGFFQGASLPDPSHLLEGTGKFMRHVKLRPGTSINEAALSKLIETAWEDIQSRL